MTARHGDWMQTYTGKAFWPLDARPDEIDPHDIAHALSMLCRYGGHCEFFVSVAEHSCLISDAVSPENALWGLVHDASEAYMVDLPRPIKNSPGFEQYRVYENRLLAVIAEAFGLPTEMPAEVKDADNRILLDERDQLMKSPPRDWGLPGEPLGVHVTGWSPSRAKQEWLARFKRLTQGGSL